MQSIFHIIAIIAVYSVLASIIFEVLSGLFNFRGRLLYKNIHNFSGKDKHFVNTIYKSKGIKDQRVFNFFRKPAYINPEIFARECFNFIRNSEYYQENESKIISSGLNPSFSFELQDLYEEAGKDNIRFRKLLCEYFQTQISPLTNKYKSITRIGLFFNGLIIAFCFNLDIFLITQNLNKPELSNVTSGWYMNYSDQSWVTGFSSFAGYLVTAFCISFGGPYWFDLMQKFTRVKA